MLAALLKLIPFRDWCYIGIIAALLAGFGVYTHHERVIGAQKEVAKVTAVLKAQEAKVAAINQHNSAVEAQANDQIQALSGALASANTDAAQRVHDDTSANRRIFVPKTDGATLKPAVASAAPSGASSTTSAAQGPQEVCADVTLIEDDLQIALIHNEQLQAVITEFQRVSH